jgi:DNA-directed RNA polymerase beta' subunit
VRLTEWVKDADGHFKPETKLVDTTVGRALLSEILPKGLPFSNINKALKKKEISRLINTSFRKCGLKETVVFATSCCSRASAWPRAPASRSRSTTCSCRRRSRA